MALDQREVESHLLNKNRKIVDNNKKLVTLPLGSDRDASTELSQLLRPLEARSQVQRRTDGYLSKKKGGKGV